MKISGLFFAMVIVAFLLPFLVVKCADTEIAKLSGLKLAIGGEVKSDFLDQMSAGVDSMKTQSGDAEKDKEKPENSNSRMKPNIYALLALVLAVGGAALAIVLDKQKYIYLVVVAALGFISLLMIKTGFNSNLVGKDTPDLSGMIKVETQFGYFLALIFFIGAAVAAFILGRPRTQAIVTEQYEGLYDKPAPVSPVYPVPPVPVDELEPEPTVPVDEIEPVPPLPMDELEPELPIEEPLDEPEEPVEQTKKDEE